MAFLAADCVSVSPPSASKVELKALQRSLGSRLNMIGADAAVRALSWFVSTNTAQSFLEFCVKAAHYLMDIGSGSRVSNGERISLKSLPANPVIFDVGANIGQYVRLLRDVLGEQPFRLYCFEPSRTAYGALVQNLNSDRRIIVINLALPSLPI